MKAELEQIVTADEEAREKVRMAKIQAGRILKEARDESAAISAKFQEATRRLIESKVVSVVEEAKKEAGEREALAQRYAGLLKERARQKEEQIIDSFINLLTGQAPLSGD